MTDTEGIQTLTAKHDQSLEELCVAAFARGRRRERADVIRRLQAINMPDVWRQRILNAVGSPEAL